MSAIERLKAQIRAQKSVQNYGQSSQTMNPIYNPNGNDIVVLPTKPKKKRKLMNVQQEHKDALDRMPQQNYSIAHPKKAEDEMDDEEVEEDEDGDVNKPRHVPWGPAELLKHLDKPEVVSDIGRVIDLVKKKENDVPVTEEDRKKGYKGEKKKEIIVWDHSKSGLGKKSDNNFFMWLQAYSAHEDKIREEQEYAMFD